ncbi:MAG: cyclic nucleotide-binding domain-containing protein [Methylococcaceae bacterium]|nr:cyclic nucleotide-binding domain-containing protein [Methylococcaceae bacterium]
MPIAANSKEAQEIRKFIPLATLPLSRFESICARIEVLTAAPGDVLFKRGDDDNELVYLLSGEVSLQAAGMQVEIIDAQSFSGRFALAHHIPRKINAVALSSLRYLRLDADWLASHKKHINHEDNTYMAGNESEDNPDDWMTTLLNSPIFESLPPANLQKLLMSLEEVRVTKGSVVLRQGDIGEYYYLIKQGQCLLSRKPSPNAREIKLAQLRSSDTFGENALLSDQPISVSVTALTDLILLRLNKEKFITLIKTPALKYIDATELEDELKTGAFIVDVRLQDDYCAWHLKGSVNAPFFSILMQFKTFDRKRTVIVVCEDGKISAAAAFLLLRHKFSVKILKNGLCSLPTEPSGELVSFVRNSTMRKTFLEDAGQEQEPEATEIPNVPEEITLEQLVAENKQLKTMLQKLKQQCAVTQQEKDFIEKQFQDLAKQTDQLKETLQQVKHT